ncbi:unnamed protein product, partial [Laminaria digitata]
RECGPTGVNSPSKENLLAPSVRGQKEEERARRCYLVAGSPILPPPPPPSPGACLSVSTSCVLCCIVQAVFGVRVNPLVVRRLVSCVVAYRLCRWCRSEPRSGSAPVALCCSVQAAFGVGVSP